MQKIPKESLISYLIEKIPELERSWGKFQEEWNDEDTIPHYLFLFEIADYIVLNRDTDIVSDLFIKIEEIQVHGDAYSQEAINVGLIEDVQNRLMRMNLGLDYFDNSLGDNTALMWERIIKFWQDGTPISGDLPKA